MLVVVLFVVVVVETVMMFSYYCLFAATHRSKDAWTITRNAK